MDIRDSHRCNLLSLQLLAEYYKVEYSQIESFYRELEKDLKFLNALNKKMDNARRFYSKGLFGRGRVDSVDWFANQRITLYVLIRLLKPVLAVETGVFYGGTTAFILNALRKNKKGRLISIDLPAVDLEKKSFQRHVNVSNSEILPGELKTGFIIPEYLKDRWQFIEQESLIAIQSIKEDFTFFSHDSEHRHDYMLKELELAKSKMSVNSTIMADDINWSNGFMEFCVNNKLYPLLLTDNGKLGLMVRLGVVYLNHPSISKKEVTG